MTVHHKYNAPIVVTGIHYAPRVQRNTKLTVVEVEVFLIGIVVLLYALTRLITFLAAPRLLHCTHKRTNTQHKTHQNVRKKKGERIIHVRSHHITASYSYCRYVYRVPLCEGNDYTHTEENNGQHFTCLRATVEK